MQTSDSKLDFLLCLRPQTQSQCLVPAQSQAPSLAYHLSRYPSFNEQHATKDAFYSHHHPAGPYSSLSTKSSLAPYGPPVRPASSYSSGSDPVQSEQGLGAQAAAQILDSAEGFVFMGAGLNPTPGGGCQAHLYSAAGHSGNSVCLLWETWWCFGLPRCSQQYPPSYLQVTTDTAVTWTASGWHHWWTSTCPSSAPLAVSGRSPPSTPKSTIRWTSWMTQEGKRLEGTSQSLNREQVSRSPTKTILEDTQQTNEMSGNISKHLRVKPSAGSAPCMFGLSSPFPSQDALLAQRGPLSSEVQDLVSSLPPINTVFMGAGGVQWCRKYKPVQEFRTSWQATCVRTEKLHGTLFFA